MQYNDTLYANQQISRCWRLTLENRVCFEHMGACGIVVENLNRAVLYTRTPLSLYPSYMYFVIILYI